MRQQLQIVAVKAGCCQQRQIVRRGAHRNMFGELPEDDIVRLQHFHEELAVGRVQVEAAARLEAAADGSEYLQPLVVVHMFGKIEREGCIELTLVLPAEVSNVIAVEVGIGNAELITLFDLVAVGTTVV